MNLNNKILSILLVITFGYFILFSYFKKEINYEFIILLILIGFIYLKLYPNKKIKDSYRQLEILIPLMNSLNIKRILPGSNALDGFAANPDFLYLIHEIIQKYKPNIIVEAGSGISTLISAYSLKKISNGTIFSLEHHENFSNSIKAEIQNHLLTNYSKIIHAPLIKYPNYDFQWYDIKSLNKIEQIDLLIIDGPPSKDSKNARYPALPLLIKKLKKGSIIILDDANRNYEKNIIKIWKKEYDCLEFTYINNSKGAYIIKKINEYN